jgi:hypothetical protein
MGWVGITLACLSAVPAIFLILAYLLRFRYSLEFAFPHAPRGSFAVSFFWFRREFRFGGDDEKNEDEEFSEASAAGPDLQGQAGFLGVGARPPFRRRMRSFRRRLRRAGRRWIVDLPVWRILAGYFARSAFRFLRRLRLGLDFLQVGSADVGAMARFASFWSVLRGAFPALACPVEYGFARPFALRLKAGGACSGLGVLFLAATLLFTFPWFRLGARFVHCWRNPRLNRWQRRLLLS